MKLNEIVIKEESEYETVAKWAAEQLPPNDRPKYIPNFYPRKGGPTYEHDYLYLTPEKPTEIPATFQCTANNAMITIHGPLTNTRNFPTGFRRVYFTEGTFSRADVPDHPDRLSLGFTKCNELTDLSKVKDYAFDWFVLAECEKITLDQLPKRIRVFSLEDCPNITSLKGIHEGGRRIGSVQLYSKYIKSHILGLLLMDTEFGKHSAKNFKGHVANPDLERALEIMEPFRGEGRKGVLAAQQALIEADLDDFAEL